MPNEYGPLSTTGEHRGGPRRAEDRAVAETVHDMAAKVEKVATTFDTEKAFVEKWKWVIMTASGAVVAIVAIVGGFASWAGATRSAPSQRIATVELGLETLSKRTDERVDSVATAVRELTAEVRRDRLHTDSVDAASMRQRALLLRISCRGLAVEFRDLREECRSVGANR
jgi:hypothetical protein